MVIFSSSSPISPFSAAISSFAIASISASPAASFTNSLASASSAWHSLYLAYMSTTPVSSPSALESFWNSLASDATSGSASLNVSSLCVRSEDSSFLMRKSGAAMATVVNRVSRGLAGAGVNRDVLGADLKGWCAMPIIALVLIAMSSTAWIGATRRSEKASTSRERNPALKLSDAGSCRGVTDQQS